MNWGNDSSVPDERRRDELTDGVHDGGAAGGPREGGEPRGADRNGAAEKRLGVIYGEFLDVIWKS